MDGEMGGRKPKEDLRDGLGSELGIRVYLPRKPRLDAKPSQAGTGAGVLGGGYWV